MKYKLSYKRLSTLTHLKACGSLWLKTLSSLAMRSASLAATSLASTVWASRYTSPGPSEITPRDPISCELTRSTMIQLSRMEEDTISDDKQVNCKE